MKRQTWEEPEIDPLTQFMFIMGMTLVAEVLAAIAVGLVFLWWSH